MMLSHQAKVGIVPSFKFTNLNLISSTTSIFVNSYYSILIM